MALLKVKRGGQHYLLPDIGAVIREHRLAREMTQRELASLLQITTVHLCNIEIGKSILSLPLLAAISEWAGMDIYVAAWARTGFSRERESAGRP